MKKNYLFSLMALFVLLFAACNSEEIVSGLNENKGPVTLNVGIPVNNPVTRVAPTIPEGFTLRCIMQLVDQSGSAIDGERYVKEVPSGAESVTFTFNIPSNYGGAMFWADYVKKGDVTEIANVADHLYTTTDLTSVVYNTDNIATLFNNDAADAFAGYMQSGTTSITLKRPFTKLTFKTSDEKYKDYTKISVTELPAPTGYNVKSGSTTGTATGITNSDMDIANGVWFSTYLFVGSNTANMGEGNDIKFTLKKEDGTSVDLLMPGKDIKLTENYNVTVNIAPSESNEQEVTVTFPGDMVDPDKPQAMAIGDYINKDGSFTKTYNADNAVAIVYALADGKVDNSSYGQEKSPIAYAMAITRIPRTNNTKAYTVIPTGDAPFASNDYNGYTYTEALLAAEGASDYATFTAFGTWKESNVTTGTNLSNWYIPSARQLMDITGILFGWNPETAGAEGTYEVNAAFKAAYEATLTTEELEKGYGWTAGASATNIMSSYMLGGSVQCVQMAADGKSIAMLNNPPKTNAYFAIRPVLTVFAAE